MLCTHFCSTFLTTLVSTSISNSHFSVIYRLVVFIMVFITLSTAFQILVNEGLISLLTDELRKYLTTMGFEHSHLENDGMVNETVTSNKEKGKDSKSAGETTINPCDTSASEAKGTLFMRRRSQLSSKNEDELKVVIERDNMIVGFVDAVDSDASDDSHSDDENPLPKRKSFKRARSRSPIIAKVNQYFSSTG